MTREEMALFMREMANYWDKQSTGPEDAGNWAGIMNAANCRKIADEIERNAKLMQLLGRAYAFRQSVYRLAAKHDGFARDLIAMEEAAKQVKEG